MRKIGVINLQEALDEARGIIGENYDLFKRLVTSFSITANKPTWDIVIFLISLKLTKDQEQFKKWMDFWAKYSSTRKYKNIRYHAPSAFSPFYSEIDIEKKFTKMMQYLYNSETELTESQSWKLFFELFYKLRAVIKPKFSKVEFKVFLTILEKQTTSLSSLNESLKMAKSNLSNYLKRIREKRVIFEGFLINLRKFDLNMFFSRIKYPLSYKEKVTNNVPKGKFLRRIYEGHIGCNYYLMSYLAPNIDKIEQYLENDKRVILDTIPNAEIDILKSDRNSRLYSFNYINYDLKKGKWNFDIDDINYNLFLFKSKNKIKNKRTIKIIENFPIDDNKELKFDRETLNILKFFYKNPQKSISQIIQELDIRESKIREAIANFEKKNILKRRVNPGSVFGLTNIIFFLKEKKEKIREIHEDLSFFPEIYSEPMINKKTKQEELMIIIRSPETILLPVLDSIYRKYERKIVDLFVIDQMYSTRQDLPLENFDTLFKKWEI
ncbi:MAG: hypothetical protein K9W46_04350 [Candidatus Heimdallarchaeum endolithica]|uniref:Uncharacterized protein n=1 Tax=Candidatus Heimdallarchaeum endolithica TaxID=2876572 RepID=A0A9Y1BSE9_9ARCH|nr:MAG: hypothetical protein K9W46_04350 [Candidatus Heimdallarchaeum endolithica]